MRQATEMLAELNVRMEVGGVLDQVCGSLTSVSTLWVTNTAHLK